MARKDEKRDPIRKTNTKIDLNVHMSDTIRGLIKRYGETSDHLQEEMALSKTERDIERINRAKDVLKTIEFSLERKGYTPKAIKEAAEEMKRYGGR